MDEQSRIRFEKLENLRKTENPYKNGFVPKHLSTQLSAEYGGYSKEKLDEKKISVCVAGRILAIRSFGKAAFVRLQDRAGVIQLYIEREKLGETPFQNFKLMDIGDIVFCEGYLFKTKTGELSIHAVGISLVTKALHPLPEKFHGITDIETRYRQRYLDLMVNEETRLVFEKRSKIVNIIRTFFLNREYLEVETPMMHPLVGGAAAKPFITHHNKLDMKLYLRIAPELYLKRLVVGGFERVFEINRNFRNEGISVQHNPEFTMIEFYEAYRTYEDFMLLTEDLFQKISQEINGSLQITYQGNTIDFKKPWAKISVEESILKYTDFKDSKKIRDKSALLQFGKSKKIEMDPKSGVGVLQMALFESEVEKHLIQPTFVTRYPLEVSPLSRKNDEDPFVVDRFELFICGREMANAFSELNDPIDQKERFALQAEAKQSGNEEACDMDEDYVRALEYGMPPAAGEGIGIDRLVMLFTDSASIRDVILFPQLRNQV